MGPEFCACGSGVREDEAKDFAAADEAVVPAEIMVEEQIEGGGFTGTEGVESAVLNFRFETAAAEGAVDAAVGKEERLRADLLWTGAFDAGDERERDVFTARGGVSESLKDDVLHREAGFGLTTN